MTFETFCFWLGAVTCVWFSEAAITGGQKREMDGTGRLVPWLVKASFWPLPSSSRVVLPVGLPRFQFSLFIRTPVGLNFPSPHSFIFADWHFCFSYFQIRSWADVLKGYSLTFKTLLSPRPVLGLCWEKSILYIMLQLRIPKGFLPWSFWGTGPVTPLIIFRCF